MSDPAWIEVAVTAARPRAVAALLRYFRDLDRAEEAFQDACLKALTRWPQDGPPRDPAAWLIFVGRNAQLDQVRRQARNVDLPDEARISDLEDAEIDMVARLDASHYRDDILLLLFICCHPELPDTQQLALALRIVSGLSVKQIARAFLVSDAAMEQRITRAKARIAGAGLAYDVPNALERSQRLAAVAAMIYLLFNAGYSASDEAIEARAVMCQEATRLARLLTKLFPAEPEITALLALLLLQHARLNARYDVAGAVVLLEDQDRNLWNSTHIAEGLALLDKALLRRTPGPYQVQAAIAACHDRAQRPQDTDWHSIERLYGTLEHMTPSPVITLNRAVAVSKARGPAPALQLIEPLATPLASYFHFHAVRGWLLAELGQAGEAATAWRQAISLSQSTAEAAQIRAQIDALALKP